MKPLKATTIVLGTIFYVAVMAAAGVLIYRTGWSSGLMASSAGDTGAAMLFSGNVLAWSIGILAAVFLASIPLRIMARFAFGRAFMHGRRGFHGHDMHGFGPGWGMRSACAPHGPPSSADMEKWFNKWQERNWEIPEHWRKVAQAAVEARKADENRTADPTENA